MAVVARILVVVGAALLVLPPGWCCTVRVPPRSGDSMVRTDCCGCKNCARNKTPERPRPSPPTNPCPCLDRTATIPDAVVDVAGLCVISIAPLAELPLIPIVVWTPLTTDVEPLSIPIHVANCAWRC